MFVIGLVGGVASGKSFVAECFQRLGAEVLDADKIGHQILNLPDVVSAIQMTWPNVVMLDGKIDRKSLAEIVFGSNSDDRQLKKLESITHPVIGQQIDAKLAELRNVGAVATVLDAPVMFKAGWHQRCDKIVFVDAKISVRQERAAERGWNPDELAKRERFQLSLEEKRQKSTDIIDNSKSKPETFSRIQELWNHWGLLTPREYSSN